MTIHTLSIKTALTLAVLSCASWAVGQEPDATRVIHGMLSRTGDTVRVTGAAQQTIQINLPTRERALLLKAARAAEAPFEVEFRGQRHIDLDGQRVFVASEQLSPAPRDMSIHAAAEGGFVLEDGTILRGCGPLAEFLSTLGIRDSRVEVRAQVLTTSDETLLHVFALRVTPRPKTITFFIRSGGKRGVPAHEKKRPFWISTPPEVRTVEGRQQKVVAIGKYKDEVRYAYAVDLSIPTPRPANGDSNAGGMSAKLEGDSQALEALQVTLEERIASWSKPLRK